MSVMKYVGMHAIGKMAMIVAIFFATAHLLFLPFTPQVFASTNTSIHHDLPVNHSDENAHSVCPSEIHQFKQSESVPCDAQCTACFSAVAYLNNKKLHGIQLLPIHTLGFTSLPMVQKTVLQI